MTHRASDNPDMSPVTRVSVTRFLVVTHSVRSSVLGGYGCIYSVFVTRDRSDRYASDSTCVGVYG